MKTISIGMFGEQRHIKIPDEADQVIREMIQYMLGKDDATDDELIDFVTADFFRRTAILLDSHLKAVGDAAVHQEVNERIARFKADSEVGQSH